MENQTVFRFVSIRAPAAQLDTDKLIEAGPHATQYLEELGIDQISSWLAGDLVDGNRRLLSTELNPLTSTKWRDMYHAQPEISILRTEFTSLPDMTDRLTADLDRFKLALNPDRLLPALWAGYLIHIFSGQDAQGQSLFFHRWIHLLDLFERGRFEPLLPLQRLVIPPSLSRLVHQRPPAADEDKDHPAAPPPGISVADNTGLSNLMVELGTLYTAKRQQAAARTAAFMDAAMQMTKDMEFDTQLGEKRGKRGSKRKSDAPKQIEADDSPESYDAVSLCEISAEGQEIIMRHNLSLDEGNLNARKQVKRLLAQQNREIFSSAKTTVFDFVGDSFVLTQRFARPASEEDS